MRFKIGGYSRLNPSNRDASPQHSQIELLQPRHSPRPADSSLSGHKSHAKPTSNRLDTNWDPVFLRRWVLVAFALFFAAVIAALQVVYSISAANRGIVTSDDEKHYLWTYGPTAIFVIVTVLWRQVDYAAKSIQPWAEMAKGPQTAKNSLLLDYVTPFQLVSLWRSIRKSHFNVAATVIVFFLIKVITILSTGIFSLRAVQQDGVATTMALNNTFDGSNFQQAASVDSRAAYVVYGQQAYNVTPPSGTSDQYTVQSFSPAENFVNGTLTFSAEVDVFSVGLECESGAITYNISYSRSSNAPTASYFNTTVTLPDCQIYNAYLDSPDWYYTQNDTTHRFGYQGSFQNVTCSNLPDNDPTRERYMVAVAYSEGIGQNENKLLNSSNLVCIPSYAIHSGMVTLDTAGNVQSVNLTGPPRKLEGVTGLDIAKGVAATSQQSYAFGGSSGDDLSLDSFLTLMQLDTPNFSETQFLDTNYLNTTANRIYGKVAAQLANFYLLSEKKPSSGSSLNGTLSREENRLVAREAPVRGMQGIAGVMLVLTLAIIFITPRGVVPRSIDSIAAVAAILARSPRLGNQLDGTGHLSLDELAMALEPDRYMTRMGYEDGSKHFAIEVISGSESEVQTISEANSIYKNVRWMQPLVLHRIAISFTILASIAAIITLEALLSQSQKHNGLASVSDNAATRYSWLYVPVFVFLLLGTLFNLMDFEIEFIESYHALSRGFCDATSSMLWYPLRHVSVHASWDGLRHGRFALTAASASAVLAPLLTIVVAGLFFAKATVQGIPIGITALNWFNTTTLETPSTNIPLLIIEGNMSYPAWTYDELSFPQLEIASNSALQISTDSGSVSVSTPALRAAVSCDVVPKSRILNLTMESGSLSSNISTPDGCGNSGLIDQPYTWLTNNIKVPVNSSGYFGSTLTLGFGSDSCPTLAIYYGHASNNEIDDFSAITCTQSLQRVQSNLTLNLPDFSVVTDTPPIVQPDSVVHFSDFYTTFPSYQAINITNTNDELDDIFNALVYGRDGVPTSELLNDTTLISSYQHLYRQYMAQVISIYLRADFNTLSDNATETVTNPLEATYINPRHFRLIQSSLSTHLLVGVLGALLICALTIFVTIDMRQVLPKPMGSIASVASLLAGSRIVDKRSGLIPKGAEYWSDEEWEKSGVWQGEMFRMGWWDKFEEPIESYGSRRVEEPAESIRSGRGTGQDVSNPRDGVNASDTARFRIDARPKIVS
ncbi:hypothetical protein LTR84_007452 [Exophiala bonariae]|uniref:Uncharacterized protein n=1 Tax=Exophiala bonariae TaxID=1690606 RepID=A0AAV9N0H0_9EURO|nr:hypothetical protein LTR84_007452 [Exophiala bonariae]